MKLRDFVWPEDRIDHKTDSIETLARFWDEHDLTDFADELEDVTERVFERSDAATGSQADQ